MQYIQDTIQQIKALYGFDLRRLTEKVVKRKAQQVDLWQGSCSSADTWNMAVIHTTESVNRPSLIHSKSKCFQTWRGSLGWFGFNMTGQCIWQHQQQMEKCGPQTICAWGCHGITAETYVGVMLPKSCSVTHYPLIRFCQQSFTVYHAFVMENICGFLSTFSWFLEI